MSVQDVSAEQFAELFHHYHEALAPDFNCSSDSLDESWEEVPANERRRLVAAVRLALLDLHSNGDQGNDTQRYFPKPGEAQWGC